MVMIKVILQQGNHPLALASPIFAAFQQNINAHITNFISADGVEQLFQDLRQKGIKIGIGTGLPKAQCYKIIDHLNWNKANFQYIGISSELGKARPDPIMILDMMQTLNIISKNSFLKVGDTLADMEEGKNAGVKTVGVLSGTQPKTTLEKGHPDFLIYEIGAIMDVINNLQSSSTI